MVGGTGAKPEGQDLNVLPVEERGEKIRGRICKVYKHPRNECCAEVHLNGCSISYSLEGCWCMLLLPDPTDEVIFKLGKSVLDCLTNRPLKGQDGSVMVIVELRI